MAGHQVGTGEVHQNQVGVHALFNHAAFGVAALGPCAADRSHHQGSGGGHGGGVVVLLLGQQGSGLDLLKEVQIVVGGGAVGAEADVHAVLDHGHNISHAAGQLQIGDGVVGGGDAPLGQQFPVLLRQPHAVGGGGGHVEDVVAVQQLGRGQTVLFHTAVVLALGLRQVDVHPDALVDAVFGHGVPQLMAGGVLAMDGSLNANPAVVVVVPLLPGGHQLLAGGILVELEVLRVKEGGTAGQIGLDAALGHGLGDGVDVVVHVRHGGDAELETLGNAQQRGGLDAPVIQPGFLGEDVLGQPRLQIIVVGVATQNGHGQVGVAVDEAGHQHHAGAVDDLLGLLRLRGRILAHIGDFSVGDADETAGVLVHGLIHGHHSGIGKQCIHSRSFRIEK